jgi:UDP-N-acetylglucosamine 2-epimerase
MYDAVLQFAVVARTRSTILRDLGLEPKGYLLATVHRPYTTDVPENLLNVLTAFLELDTPVIFPVHPRTRLRIAELNGAIDFGHPSCKVRLIEPTSYLDMLVLEENADIILTDSGGMQKEAYFLGVPCVTLRPETEWVETVASGWNVLTGTKPSRIVEAVEKKDWPSDSSRNIFGFGDAASRIVETLCSRESSTSRMPLEAAN